MKAANRKFRLFACISIAFISASCITGDKPNDYNGILKGVLNAHEDRSAFFDSTVAEIGFDIPLTIAYLDNLFYAKNTNQDVKSIVTDSEVEHWNNQLKNLMQINFSESHLENIPYYNSSSAKIKNTQSSVLDFEYFIKVSEPILNDDLNKALIYTEYYYGLESELSNSYIMILEKEKSIWKVVYKGALVES